MSEIQLGDCDAAQQALNFWFQAVPHDVLQHPVAGLLAALRGDRSAAEGHVAATVAARRSFGHYHHAQYQTSPASTPSSAGRTRRSTGFTLPRATGTRVASSSDAIDCWNRFTPTRVSWH